MRVHFRAMTVVRAICSFLFNIRQVRLSLPSSRTPSIFSSARSRCWRSKYFIVVVAGPSSLVTMTQKPLTGAGAGLRASAEKAVRANNAAIHRMFFIPVAFLLPESTLPDHSSQPISSNPTQPQTVARQQHTNCKIAVHLPKPHFRRPLATFPTTFRLF